MQDQWRNVGYTYEERTIGWGEIYECGGRIMGGREGWGKFMNVAGGSWEEGRDGGNYECGGRIMGGREGWGEIMNVAGGSWEEGRDGGKL